jgi:hypothetical protein
MEISSPARLALAYVDCDPSVAGHDANKSYLLISAPAPDTGADRNGHRTRLTSPGRLAFRATRHPLPLHCAAASMSRSGEVCRSLIMPSATTTRSTSPTPIPARSKKVCSGVEIGKPLRKVVRPRSLR